MGYDPTVFVVADLHFGHEKLAKVRGFSSVQEHDAAVVAAWNAVVRKRDTVYVLGDLFRLDRVGELNGVKKLAMGNHDQKPIASYIALFSQIRAYYEFDGCLLSHIPVHGSQKLRYDLNVHGHTHAKHIQDQWYVPVSLEHCARMEPLPLRPLVERARKELIRAREQMDAGVIT